MTPAFFLIKNKLKRSSKSVSFWSADFVAYQIADVIFQDEEESQHDKANNVAVSSGKTNEIRLSLSCTLCLPLI